MNHHNDTTTTIAAAGLFLMRLFFGGLVALGVVLAAIEGLKFLQNLHNL